MSGVRIVGGLVRADAGIAAIVPMNRIKAGMLPDNVILPALLVRSVSVIERIKLKRTGKIRFTERVSVTVRASNYDQQDQVLDLVLLCCAGVTADEMEGATSISILNAGRGPDVIGPANSFEKTQDFRVSYET